MKKEPELLEHFDRKSRPKNASEPEHKKCADYSYLEPTTTRTHTCTHTHTLEHFKLASSFHNCSLSAAKTMC